MSGDIAEVKSIDDVLALDKRGDIRALVRDELYEAFQDYCGGQIRYWNNKMDMFIQNLWHEAYLSNFEGERYSAVFDEVITLKQRQLDPNEYKN